MNILEILGTLLLAMIIFGIVVNIGFAIYEKFEYRRMYNEERERNKKLKDELESVKAELRERKFLEKNYE